ncbi:MAG: alkaline phosphatase D family protein [Bacteroidota bacterium]
MIQLIIGHTTSETSTIWIKGIDGQTQANITLKTDGKSPINIPNIELDNLRFNTAVITLQNLDADSVYNITVVFDVGNNVKGKFRTLPTDADEFTFLLGSCHFSQGVDPSSPEFEHINNIASATNAKFMMNCGDQMYIDTAVLPIWVNNDWGYAERYMETWHSPEVQKVFANLPQYMILDDHEIFNDFSSQNVSGKKLKLFNWALSTYDVFQHSHNPNNYNKIYYSFDTLFASFFVLDVRTERTEAEMISSKQMEDLTLWINDIDTADRVKVIVSPVPFITQLEKKSNKDKWSGNKYKTQRNQIIDTIFNSPCQKFLLLSGDIHLSVNSSIKQTAGNNKILHELISSPIKQLQANLLSSTKINLLPDHPNYSYKLGKRMGNPVNKGASRIKLQNNIMAITLSKTTIKYSVYSLVNGELIDDFTDNLSFTN